MSFDIRVTKNQETLRTVVKNLFKGQSISRFLNYDFHKKLLVHMLCFKLQHVVKNPRDNPKTTVWKVVSNKKDLLQLNVKEEFNEPVTDFTLKLYFAVADSLAILTHFITVETLEVKLKILLKAPSLIFPKKFYDITGGALANELSSTLNKLPPLHAVTHTELKNTLASLHALRPRIEQLHANYAALERNLRANCNVQNNVLTDMVCMCFLSCVNHTDSFESLNIQLDMLINIRGLQEVFNRIIQQARALGLPAHQTEMEQLQKARTQIYNIIGTTVGFGHCNCDAWQNMLRQLETFFQEVTRVTTVPFTTLVEFENACMNQLQTAHNTTEQVRHNECEVERLSSQLDATVDIEDRAALEAQLAAARETLERVRLEAATWAQTHAAESIEQLQRLRATYEAQLKEADEQLTNARQRAILAKHASQAEKEELQEQVDRFEQQRRAALGEITALQQNLLRQQTESQIRDMQANQALNDERRKLLEAGLRAATQEQERTRLQNELAQLQGVMTDTQRQINDYKTALAVTEARRLEQQEATNEANRMRLVAEEARLQADAARLQAEAAREAAETARLAAVAGEENAIRQSNTAAEHVILAQQEADRKAAEARAAQTQAETALNALQVAENATMQAQAQAAQAHAQAVQATAQAAEATAQAAQAHAARQAAEARAVQAEIERQAADARALQDQVSRTLAQAERDAANTRREAEREAAEKKAKELQDQLQRVEERAKKLEEDLAAQNAAAEAAARQAEAAARQAEADRQAREAADRQAREAEVARQEAARQAEVARQEAADRQAREAEIARQAEVARQEAADRQAEADRQAREAADRQADRQAREAADRQAEAARQEAEAARKAEEYREAAEEDFKAEAAKKARQSRKSVIQAKRQAVRQAKIEKELEDVDIQAAAEDMQAASEQQERKALDEKLVGLVDNLYWANFIGATAQEILQPLSLDQLKLYNILVSKILGVVRLFNDKVIQIRQQISSTKLLLLTKETLFSNVEGKQKEFDAVLGSKLSLQDKLNQLVNMLNLLQLNLEDPALLLKDLTNWFDMLFIVLNSPSDEEAYKKMKDNYEGLVHLKQRILDSEDDIIRAALIASGLTKPYYRSLGDELPSAQMDSKSQGDDDESSEEDVRMHSGPLFYSEVENLFAELNLLNEMFTGTVMDVNSLNSRPESKDIGNYLSQKRKLLETLKAQLVDLRVQGAGNIKETYEIDAPSVQDQYNKLQDMEERFVELFKEYKQQRLVSLRRPRKRRVLSPNDSDSTEDEEQERGGDELPGGNDEELPVQELPVAEPTHYKYQRCNEAVANAADPVLIIEQPTEPLCNAMQERLRMFEFYDFSHLSKSTFDVDLRNLLKDYFLVGKALQAIPDVKDETKNQRLIIAHSVIAIYSCYYFQERPNFNLLGLEIENVELTFIKAAGAWENSFRPNLLIHLNTLKRLLHRNIQAYYKFIPRANTKKAPAFYNIISTTGPAEPAANIANTYFIIVIVRQVGRHKVTIACYPLLPKVHFDPLYTIPQVERARLRR